MEKITEEWDGRKVAPHLQKTKFIGVYVTAELEQRLARKAGLERRSKSFILRDAIEFYLRNVA